VCEVMARGELVEPFGAAGRVISPFGYWLVRFPARRERPALAAFEAWILEQARLTREALAAPDMLPASRQNA
jgi:LysR family transcriptional regulator, glycine cleavage system transcriptional activator